MFLNVLHYCFRVFVIMKLAASLWVLGVGTFEGACTNTSLESGLIKSYRTTFKSTFGTTSFTTFEDGLKWVVILVMFLSFWSCLFITWTERKTFLAGPTLLCLLQSSKNMAFVWVMWLPSAYVNSAYTGSGIDEICKSFISLQTLEKVGACIKQTLSNVGGVRFWHNNKRMWRLNRA